MLFMIGKGRWPPQSQEERCLAYWLTKSVYLLDLLQYINIYRKQMYPPPPQTHEVSNTEFDMKYPDRLLLTSSGQEWQFHISTDI